MEQAHLTKIYERQPTETKRFGPKITTGKAVPRTGSLRKTGRVPNIKSAQTVTYKNFQKSRNNCEDCICSYEMHFQETKPPPRNVTFFLELSAQNS